MLYLFLSVRPSVGGLLPHRSTNRNNLDAVGMHKHNFLALKKNIDTPNCPKFGNEWEVAAQGVVFQSQTAFFCQACNL